MFIKFNAYVGTVRMIAPFPSTERREVPTTLEAETLAYIGDPQGSANGYDVNVVKETEQRLA